MTIPMTPGAVVGDKYRLTRLIGTGGMGVVWAAKHDVTGRDIAIKLITNPTPDLRVRLLREARACGRLAHRNVIEVLDVGELDERDPFLVMPLLSGETLADYLARQRRLLPATAAQIARDIARALEAAHAAQIIHRDLKPANIFLHQEAGTEGHVVKVLDFGVSKNLAEQDGLMTVAGGAVGSPAYMSPEQIGQLKPLGKRPEVDYRTDIWSLGVVLFEMLTGRRPFDGDTAEVIRQVTTGPIPSVSQYVRSVEAGLDELVSRCLVRNPSERLGSAGELAKALTFYNEASRVYTGLPVRPSEPAPEPPAVARSSAASPMPALGPSPTHTPAFRQETGYSAVAPVSSVSSTPRAPLRAEATGPSPHPASLQANPGPHRPQAYLSPPAPALAPPSAALVGGGTVPIYAADFARPALAPPAPPAPHAPHTPVGMAAYMPDGSDDLQDVATKKLDIGRLAAWRPATQSATAESSAPPLSALPLSALPLSASPLSAPPLSTAPLSASVPPSNAPHPALGAGDLPRGFGGTMQMLPTYSEIAKHLPTPAHSSAPTTSTAPLVQPASEAPSKRRGALLAGGIAGTVGLLAIIAIVTIKLTSAASSTEAPSIPEATPPVSAALTASAVTPPTTPPSDTPPAMPIPSATPNTGGAPAIAPAASSSGKTHLAGSTASHSIPPTTKTAVPDSRSSVRPPPPPGPKANGKCGRYIKTNCKTDPTNL